MIFSSSRSLPFCFIRCLSVVQVTAFLLFAAFPLSRSPPFCYIRCLSVEHLLPFRCTYCLSVVLSPPFRNHCTYCRSVVLSLPFCFPFTAFPLSIHCFSVVLPLSFLVSYCLSLPVHCLFLIPVTAFPLSFHCLVLLLARRLLRALPRKLPPARRRPLATLPSTCYTFIARPPPPPLCRTPAPAARVRPAHAKWNAAVGRCGG